MLIFWLTFFCFAHIISLKLKLLGGGEKMLEHMLAKEKLNELRAQAQRSNRKGRG